MNKKPLIGFVGQGFIGKNYADDFEKRGYSVIRYARKKPLAANKEKIKNCDMVFIAVPTPTTPKGFDFSVVREVIKLVGVGKIAVVKSTILPGTAKIIQKEYPDRIILHSPEFLSEVTAAEDAANPFSNIIGLPENSNRHKKAAERVMSVLPKSPFNLICASEEAELFKYIHNASGYTQIVFFNLMYDLAKAVGADWQVIEQAVKADPYIPNRYARPVHKSGRGAGGHCFIKDFEALSALYCKWFSNSKGCAFFKATASKNNELLIESGKDLDLLRGVYGNEIIDSYSKN
ncbi:MAG: hypothetical protein AAB537_00835 [Patescibacteria group bacterium]